MGQLFSGKSIKLFTAGEANGKVLSCPPAPLLGLLGLLIGLSVTGCTGSLAINQSMSTSEISAPVSPTNQSTSNPTVQLKPTTTPTASSTPTATRPSTPSATPTDTPRPTSTPTPEPALRRLTSGGCCVQPSFSPDGQQVLFIDKPGEEAPVGIYGLELNHPQPSPTLVNEIIGFRSPDRSTVATLQGDLARFTNEQSGQSWTVDTGGNWPRYSPQGDRILWAATDREGPYDRRQTDIWLANLDGSNSQLILSTYGGGVADWFPDGQRLLIIGRDTPSEEKQTLFSYDLTNGQRVNLFSHKRLREAEISPGGSWIVFFVTFSDDEAVENGLWVVSADGAVQRRLELPGFGAYRWQDDQTLLLIPMRSPGQESMQLWAIEVATNQSRPLTDPASLSFSISNGDWEVSPDGRQVIFVNSADQNIWLITLP